MQRTTSPLRRLTSASALVLALASVAACDNGSAAMEAVPAATPVDAAYAGDADITKNEAEESGAYDDPIAGERMIIHNASIVLTAHDPESVIAKAVELAGDAGGHASASDASTYDGSIHHASATLRIPADRFEQTLDLLREHGELVSESLSGEDVTEQYMDLEARLKAQRTLEIRLLGLVAEANSVAETLEVERELARVRGEVESLEARTRDLSGRAAMATIDLRVHSPNAEEAPGISSAMASAVDDARKLSIGTLGVFIRAVGVLLPIWALALPVFVIVRSRRKKPKLVTPSAPPQA